MASITAILAVGVNPSGHGSSTIPMSIVISATVPRSESGWGRDSYDRPQAEVPPQFQHFQHFPGHSTLGKGHHAILRPDQAQIAMGRLARMDVGRRSPGRAQSGGKLAGDVPGLSHAGRQDFSGAVAEGENSALESARDRHR